MMRTGHRLARWGGSGESVLLERDRELEAIDGLLRDALSANARVGLLEGPAGIGKSRLLAAARERAVAAGFRVLAARASDFERELPFGVVRQLFEPALADRAGRERWLCGSAAAAARVFEPPQEVNPSADVSFGVLYGLLWLTINLAAEEPVLLCIDDLHWCDLASLRFVAYLERRLSGLRILIATAIRSGEPRGEERLLGEIMQDPAAVSIHPQELSGGAVTELVREQLDCAVDPRFSAACGRATGGNPLLLRELLKTMRAEGVRPDAANAEVVRDIGPRALSRTVLLRLARLPDDALAVSRAVAVLGGGAGLPAIAALSGLDEPRVADAARALVHAGILGPEPPLGFAHPLVRDAVYRELAPVARELQHERAARLLSDLGAASELVAAHLLAAPSRADGWVVAVLRRAGLEAGRRGDAASAVSYLRRALAEPPSSELRPQLLLELGWAEAGEDTAAASEHMSAAYEQLTDPRQRALAARVLSRMLLFAGPAQEAVAVARRALAELPAENVDERCALDAFELYAVAFGAEVPDAAARLASARDRGVQRGIGGKILSAVAAWDWALAGGCARECSELALAALADGALVAADPGFGGVIAGGVLGLAECEEALDVWDAATHEAHRLGSLRTLCIVNIWRGWTWLERGELAEAHDTLRDSLEQIERLESNGAGMAYVAAFLARVLLERGDLAGARELLANRRQLAPMSDGDSLARRSRIELLLAESRWKQALTAADEYQARLRDVDNPAWAPWRSLRALALTGLGQSEDALALLEQELAASRRWGAPGAIARTLRLLGTLRRQEGHDLLREAVAVAGASPARLEHAKALVSLGSALRRARRPTDAREPLRRGFELANHCGATLLAQSAKTELYAAGGRTRREVLSGPESLTPSERRIADLAANGQSNRDIAQTLYITPKTVEVHLTSIYRKLGISARTALPGALTR